MIVGISGKRGVGKTLAATHMEGFAVVSFATELRRIAKTLLPFTDADFTNVNKKEKPFKHYDFSPRDFLVHLGEFMRFHDSEYWVKIGLALCKDHAKKNYVFDDVRYENEAEAIKKMGGMLLRIERYEKNNPYGKNLDTPSETSLDAYKFDYVVERMWNVEQEDLFRQVDAFIAAKCQVKAK